MIRKFLEDLVLWLVPSMIDLPVHLLPERCYPAASPQAFVKYRDERKEGRQEGKEEDKVTVDI